MTRMNQVIAAALSGALLAASAAEAADSSRIKRVVSPGGIEAWLVEEHAIPMIAVEIGFAGGARLDPEDKSGAAYLAAALIEEGAGDLDAIAFQSRLDDLSARMKFDATRDGFYVGLRTLTENAAESFDLLRLALTEPRFDERPVERVRAQVLSRLKSDAVDPQSQASEAWFRAMFPNDAYGRKPEGTLDSVAALTQEDLRAAFERMVAQDRMHIGVVGDIDAESLAALLDETFGDLPEGAALTEPPVEVRAAGGTEIVRVEVPQSVAMFGHEGLLRSDPDFIPAYVLNHILGGGGFTSRLMTEVREKNGLAYSVYSYLYPLDRAGVMLGAVATANDRVGRSIALIREEWRKIAEEGVSAEELEAAKKYLTGAFALRFDSNAKIARYLVSAQEADLGVDYIDRRNDLVEAVTLEDIRRVADRVMRPDGLFIVVVGDPANLEG